MPIRTLPLVVLACTLTGASAQTLLPVVTSTRIEGTRLSPDEAEKEFLQNATRAGHAELKAGELAMRKASDPDVKRYAQQMVTEHRQALSMLQTLAKERGMNLPDGPSMRQNTRLKRLEASKGATFDRRYIDDFGADAHDETIGEARRVLSQGQHAGTKQVASQLLPRLEAHLVAAKELQAKLAAGIGRNRAGGAAGSNLPPAGGASAAPSR